MDIKKLIELVNKYKQGLDDTGMEGFDMEYEEACELLDDLVLAAQNGLAD